ncbi:hypothetical protein TNCV_3992151 [Trichonephila clavipes]|uniref:Uncharacterized protein n=1 Tax=Trichonephila clavipes TaxID=2585209 RepID=A0A8X6T670_TRICX|nr:hypothetical protein TNCV_3992151 [Trichonephila clavipes]
MAVANLVDWNPGKNNVVSRTLLESPEVLLQGCGIETVNSPSKQNRECYAAAKTVALGNRTKGVQPNSTKT